LAAFLIMATDRAHSRAERILTFEEAQQVVLNHAAALRTVARATQSVRLLDSLGRTLTEDILADRDFPPFPRATRDGYAVRSQDLQQPSLQFEVVGEIRAGGDLPKGFNCLKSGETVSIMTGAPVPEGADAVVMVEYSERQGKRVRFSKSAIAGENIVPRGAEARAGTVLVPRGAIIGHQQIALAAAVGKSSLSVSLRPRIAILPTGDELVSIDARPGDNQIRNSNSYSLAAQVITAGGEAMQLPIAPDKPEALRELIERGLQGDVLLMSGGVSAGEYDFVEDVLAKFSAEFLFTGVQIQPGKPLVFGRAQRRVAEDGFTYFFGLPGNPISTMVTFELFVRPIVRALSQAAFERMRSAKARLSAALKVKTGLTRFLPARLSGAWDDARVEPVKWQGSGDIAAFAHADCLLVVPADREQFEAGEMMTVVLL
jgi:molybdopterin molybdotransferase